MHQLLKIIVCVVIGIAAFNYLTGGALVRSLRDAGVGSKSTVVLEGEQASIKPRFAEVTIVMFVLGSILMAVAHFWSIIAAFKEGDMIWGIAGFVIPLVALVYLIIHSLELKVPLVLYAIGMWVTLLGIASLYI